MNLSKTLLAVSMVFALNCCEQTEPAPINLNNTSLTNSTITYPLICSWAGGTSGTGLSPATQYAMSTVQSICASLQVPYIPTFRGGVPNASATSINNTPVIIYNPQFLNAMGTGHPAAPISILAHEVGHHINQDITWFGQFKHPWTKELQADFVSGVALRRLGFSLQDALSAQLLYFNQIGSQSHPDSYKRIDAISAGWYRG